MLAYLKILRPVNLLIIILTMGLLRFCVIEPFFALGNATPAMDYFDFGLLLLATLLIAAGGYVVNDYYDTAIDQVNKPAKTIAGKTIPLKKIKTYYGILTMLGLLTGLWLAYRIDYFLLALIFPVVAIMLWYYSVKYQKTYLAGNLMIALMSGLVVLIVWIAEMFALLANPVKYVEVINQVKIVGWITLAYTLFAFLVTLVREVLKDIEDMQGDSAHGYRTLPIVSGIRKARAIAAVVAALVILALGIFQYYLYLQGFTLVFWYLLIAVQTLLLYLIYQTLQSQTKEDFNFASNVSKIIMLAGILSMQLFYISL